MNDLLIKYNDNKSIRVPINTKIIDVLKKVSLDNIVGAKVDNVVVNLDTKLKKDTLINFIDSNDLAGYKMMQAGLKFVLLSAVKDLYKNVNITFDHSIMRGMHITIDKDDLTDKDILDIKRRMDYIINSDLKITKLTVLNKEMIDYYKKIHNEACSYNILNIDSEYVSLYKLENHLAYFYMELPYSTKCLNKYDVVKLSDKEIVLLFPTPRTSHAVPSYVHYEKVIKCFKQEKEWLNKLEIPYVYQVNKIVTSGKVKDLIRLSEINYDSKIENAVNEIINKNKKCILIAGPSSSGKTTTCKKMALNLNAHGIKTIEISLDDYFKNREDTPKLEDGSYDFESVKSIDIETFNKDMNKLLKGESVNLPIYNFVRGEREYHNNIVTMSKDSVILIEGLHCLNNEITNMISDDAKYKIYLSPFMPLNIDSNNYISTTDLRLIRRIIRDNRTRGADVSTTISTWQKVRDGEEKYIFPFINTSDCIINTSLVYELGVLKVFAEPLLYSVTPDSMYFEEARRLIGFLRNYFPISSEYINDSCVLREFIGGSCFK